MRALGLPNTKHFHEITRIEDALARESFRNSFSPSDLIESHNHQSPKS